MSVHGKANGKERLSQLMNGMLFAFRAQWEMFSRSYTGRC